MAAIDCECVEPHERWIIRKAIYIGVSTGALANGHALSPCGLIGTRIVGQWQRLAVIG